MGISDDESTNYNRDFYDAIAARYCARPVSVGSGQFVRCQSRLKSKCPSCSEINRGDWAAIARSGVFDAEGHLTEGYTFFLLTLTAPSFGKVNPDGSAHKPSSYDYLGQVEWNSASGKLWNSTLSTLKRSFPDLSYFAVREAQRRGVLHFHVLLRLPIGHAPEFAQQIAMLARSATAALPWGTVVEWGKQADCQRIGDNNDSTAQAVWYLSKALQYAVKDVDSTLDPDADGSDPSFRHHLKLRQTARFRMHCARCWASGENPIDCPAPVHENLGAPSNVVSYARGSKHTPAWSFSGLTRKRQREARTDWVREQVAEGLMNPSAVLSDFDLDAARYVREHRWTARQTVESDPGSPRAPSAQ